MNNEIELNIQPQASILGVFSRLNYKPWYALAEFVDNSTASFFGHQQIMKFYKIRKISIFIEYDAYENILIIKDNAYGMEISDFIRAIQLDSTPENLNGRNEFGMGLKTAASWFGNIWSVSSTQLGSSNNYYAEINIHKLKSNNLNSISIIKSTVKENTHGTTITIKDVTKKIDSPRTKNKIKELLTSMYRRDLSSGKVDIYFNGDLLKFKPFKILKFRKKEWKKEIDFSFNFNNKNYHVNGFVAIMETGSYLTAGFALFRYNRVIIGGDEQNYKPREIFSQAQSQISLKLFGELNMEDFPVNQAKDGFVWDDGLEETFLSVLKQNIKEYIDIAKLSKHERISEEELSTTSAREIEENINNNLSNIILDDDFNENDSIILDTNFKTELDQFKTEMYQNNTGNNLLIDQVREYSVRLNPIKTKVFKVFWKIGENDNWIEYNAEKTEILININHPFFKPYSANLDFKEILDKFVVAFISAEELTKISLENDNKNYETYIFSIFRAKINNILKKLSDKA